MIVVPRVRAALVRRQEQSIIVKSSVGMKKPLPAHTGKGFFASAKNA